MKAAENGQEAVVRLLLEKGANIEPKDYLRAEDYFDLTALKEAVETGE